MFSHLLKICVQTKSHVMYLGYGFFPYHITTVTASIFSILTIEAACQCKKLVSTYQNTYHKLKDNNLNC